MKHGKVVLIAFVAALSSGCASTDRIPAPDGIAHHELMMCQHFGNLYANVAQGRDMGYTQERLTNIMVDGVQKATMPEMMRPTMLQWAPAAVTRVYSAPDTVTAADWRLHVETECMDRILKHKQG